MNSVFMCYYEHLAKLSRIANKQTLFLAHVLYRMEWNKESKQFIAYLTTAQKREIINAIGCDCKNPLNSVKQYIGALTKAGMIKSIGGGAYLIDPASYGGSKYVPKNLRMKNSKLYETMVFTETTGDVEQSYIVTEDGERIDLN